MKRKIRFFNKHTGEDAPKHLNFIICWDGSVWRDNFRTYESQCSVVNFDDFVEECPDIDWEIITNS